MRDLKVLASHLGHAAGALEAGSWVYLDWHLERRLSGSDADFGDAEQRAMASKLEKAHTQLHNAHRLSNDVPGWFSVRGMKLPNDLFESRPYPAIKEAMRLHAEALELVAGDLARRVDGDQGTAYADEGLRRWLEWFSGCAWNLRPTGASDPRAMVQ